jgi:putative transposon-encoded protein
MSKKIKIKKEMTIEDPKEVFTKEVQKLGNSAMVRCEKKYIGKKATLIIGGKRK